MLASEPNDLTASTTCVGVNGAGIFAVASVTARSLSVSGYRRPEKKASSNCAYTSGSMFSPSARVTGECSNVLKATSAKYWTK